MKKIPAILLSLLLLFSLAACTDGGEAEPTELGARNAYRAAVLAETVFEDYYNEDTGIAPEKLPETDGVDIASVWDYVTMMSLADRMIDVDGENARWTELRDSLYAFLPYYGQFRTDEWTDVPYASRRGDREFWSTATMTYDDQIWIIREFLNTYEKTENAEYLNMAKELTAFCIDDAWEEKLGGFYWGTDHTTRNTCSNAPFVREFVRLYEITGEQDYLDWAVKVYEWTYETLRDPADNTYYDHVGTSKDPDTGEAAGTDPPNRDKYSYNSGAMISAGVALYEATGEEKYFEQAKQTAAGTFAYFAVPYDDIVPGETLYYYPVSTTNWFNLIMLMGFYDLWEYDKENCDLYIGAMQDSIDYAYENYLQDGYIPVYFLRGWLPGYDKCENKALIDQTSHAEIYALLAQHQERADET